MMDERLCIRELRQRFIKDKQRESQDSPVKIKDYLVPYLSDSDRHELRIQLEELVAGEEEFGRFVESSIDLGELWSDRIAPGMAAAHQQEETAIPTIGIPIELMAQAIPQRPAAHIPRDRSRATLQPRDPDVWQLNLDGNENIPLPSEIAKRCYGKDEQKLALRLHRVPVAVEGMFEPQLEVLPPPTHDKLIFQLSFPSGDKRTLEVPASRRSRSSNWSRRTEPLPADAFGTDGWELKLGTRI